MTSLIDWLEYVKAGGPPIWLDPLRPPRSLIAPNEEAEVQRFLWGKRETWPEPVTGTGYVIDVTLYDRKGESFVVSSEPFRIEVH